MKFSDGVFVGAFFGIFLGAALLLFVQAVDDEPDACAPARTLGSEVFPGARARVGE